MHVTFVKPTLGCLAAGGRFVDEARMEPLSLGVLAGLTPPEVECSLVDDRIDTLDVTAPTDLVAINVETFTARRAYEISRLYRARGVPVVMGGMHATLVPDEVAEHCDAVYTGDGESLWAQVVSDARNGTLRRRYDGGVGVPQSGVRPRRDLYAGKGYLPISLLQFGRGCPHRCEFCAVGAYFSHHHVSRPVDEVIEEIKDQPRRNLFFVDDNLVADVDAAKSLLAALIPLKVRWVSQVTVSHAHDRELLRLFVDSGCMGNVIGFESLDPANLRQMRKGQNLARFDQYAATIAALRAHHLQTWAALLVGYDSDTVESIEATCDWAIQQKFTFAAFNILMPYPSTPLYQRFADDGRLLYHGRWWLDPDYRFNHAAFVPARMTADELTEAAWRCRRRWSSASSIVRRAVEPSTNMASLYRFAVYCAYNPLFRREAFKKQGMRLGTT